MKEKKKPVSSSSSLYPVVCRCRCRRRCDDVMMVSSALLLPVAIVVSHLLMGSSKSKYLKK